MWRKEKRDRIGWYCYWNICWNSYNAKHFASKANNVICQQLTPSLLNLPSFPPSFRSGKFSVVAQNFPRATNTIFPRKRETNLLVARKGDASTLPSSSSARHHLVEKEIDLREIVQRSSFYFIYLFFPRTRTRTIGLTRWSTLRKIDHFIVAFNFVLRGLFVVSRRYRAIDTIQGERGEDRFLADKVNVENVEKYLFALDFVFEAIVLSRVYVRALDYISRWENYSTPRDNENIKRVKISRNLSTF